MTEIQPLKLLLSAFALRTWGARIEAACGGLSLVTAEDEVASRLKAKIESGLTPATAAP